MSYPLFVQERMPEGLRRTTEAVRASPAIPLLVAAARGDGTMRVCDS